MKTKTNIVEYHMCKRTDEKELFIHHLKTLREAETAARKGIKEHGFDSVRIIRVRLYESNPYGIPIREWKSDGFDKTIYKKK
jgi:hypothetical protein